MLLTRREAMQIRCPLSKVMPHPKDDEGGDATQADDYCQGNRCAVWRWHDPEAGADIKTRRGYCGLGGKP